MSRRLLEWLKTALIAVLFVSAILLGYSSSVFTGLFGALKASSGAAEGPVMPGSTLAEAARPYVLVLTSSDEGRAMFKYDMDALDLTYARTSSSVSDALRSASAPERCSEAAWREALQSTGIMFEYFDDIPLELVRDWLGATGDGFDISVRRICLVFGDGTDMLYFEGNGGFFISQTASLGSGFSVSASYSSNLQYEFELDRDAAAPYMLLHDSDSSHPTAVCVNPLAAADGGINTDALSSAVSALGVDLRQTSGSFEADGTRTYVSNAFVLSVSPDGVVNYRRSAADNDSQLELCDSVELARRIVSATIGALSGEARLYYTGFSDLDGSYIITFDYFFAGGRVLLNGDSHAASVTITGGAISEITLHFRTLTPGDMYVLLPETYTLAISGGEFALGYADGAAAAPFWYSRAAGGEL